MDFLNDPKYIVVIDHLRKYYPPAMSATDADEFLSSSEICEAINDTFSTSLSYEDIHLLLLDQGYNLHPIGQIKSCWMIKKTNNA